MRTILIPLASLCVAGLLGCESAPPPQTADRSEGITLQPPAPAAPAEPAPPPPAPDAPSRAQQAIDEGIAKARAAMAAKEAAEAAADGAAAPADAAAPAAAPADGAVPDAPVPDAAAPPAGAPVEEQPPQEGDQLSRAEVGVGVKGKDYGGPGIITTPIQTYFQAQDRIDFDVQIPKAMQLYKAAHNEKGPKTHEEFMQVIIKEHGVQLPELPPGQSYWYDAKTEQLMVRQPKPAT